MSWITHEKGVRHPSGERVVRGRLYEPFRRRDPVMSNPPPSKNRENQDSATLTQSQPSTVEEVEARAGQPDTAAPADQDELDDQPRGEV